MSLLLGLTGSAFAVGKVGSAVRVDQDPNTATYKVGPSYNIARTPAGGFAIAWEEERNATSGVDAVRYRVFRPSGTAVAAPASANITGRIEPGLSRITPLGADSLYLLYLASRLPPAIDEKGKREIFGQRILLSTGLATGSRSALNNTVNEGESVVRSAALSNGRAVLAWFDDGNFTPLPGRFISATGVPQPANLSFACCVGAQITSLDGLGTGLLGTYRNISLLNNKNELYGRIYKADGAPLNAPKKLEVGDDLFPGLRALSNGRILFFRSVPVGSKRRLVGQLYSQTWQKVGTQKTLIADQTSTTGFVFAPTTDGGVLMVRVQKVGSAHSYVIQRLNANLVPVGSSSPNLTLAAEGTETPRITVLNSSRAVIAFRKTVGNRPRLLAQMLSY